MKKQDSDSTKFAQGSAIEEPAASPEQTLNALFQHVTGNASVPPTEEILGSNPLTLREMEDGSIQRKLSPAPFDALIQDVAASVQPLMEQKQIAFVLDSPHTGDPVILVDGPQFREILIQLLSHAAGLTPAGGRIELAAECLYPDASGINSRIVIRDSGAGTREKMQADGLACSAPAHAREPNCCNTSNSRLSSVERLIASMGGQIAVSDGQDTETEYTVYLNFARLASLPNDSALPPGEASDVVGLKILLCEGDAMSMQITRRILERNGAFVVPASDGMHGYRKFMISRPNEFDCILMDLHLPHMDGYTTAQRIRESGHPSAKTIPILAMSSDSHAMDTDRTLASGMDSYLAKPINPQKLILEICRLTKCARE